MLAAIELGIVLAALVRLADLVPLLGQLEGKDEAAISCKSY